MRLIASAFVVAAMAAACFHGLKPDQFQVALLVLSCAAALCLMGLLEEIL